MNNILHYQYFISTIEKVLVDLLDPKDLELIPRHLELVHHAVGDRFDKNNELAVHSPLTLIDLVAHTAYINLELREVMYKSTYIDNILVILIGKYHE